MQKALLFFLLAFGLAGSSFAQTDSTAHRREIGFSTSIILNNIFNSSGSPVELLLKQQRNNSWVRWGLGLHGNRSTYFSNPGDDASTVEKYFFLSPSVGVEKRTTLSTRWFILYGGDVLVSGYLRQYKRTQNDIVTQKDDIYNIGGGVRPFLGLGFNILPKLYISTEASGLLGANLIKRNSELTSANSEPVLSKQNGWSGNLSLRPASSIFVYYRF